MIAQKPPANLGQMDEQLAGLNQQLAQSASVLDELASIQVQFDDLAQTYADFKAYAQRLQSEDGGGIVTLRQDMEQRFLAVENSIKDAQRSFADGGGEGEDPREAVQIHIENLENRLRQELRGALSRIDQAGFSPVQIEKVEKLDIQMRGMRNALRTAERRERMLQNWLAAVTIMALMALGMPMLMPLILGDSDPSPVKSRSSARSLKLGKPSPLSESIDTGFESAPSARDSSRSLRRDLL